MSAIARIIQGSPLNNSATSLQADVICILLSPLIKVFYSLIEIANYVPFFTLLIFKELIFKFCCCYF